MQSSEFIYQLLGATPNSAIPLKRWVLRTRPLRGQSRHYPYYLGHSPKPKIASRFSSTPHLKRFGVLVGRCE